jgi:hypothetical protein
MWRLQGLHPRSQLPEEQMTVIWTSDVVNRSLGANCFDQMNAICPNVIRTNISSPAFYGKLDGMGLLTPMEGLINAFESMLESNDTSGEIFEVNAVG